MPWLRLTCLGGFGEQGRCALLVETGDARFLIDYGVKKTISETHVGEPPLEPPNVESLDFVLLTHAHQDHTAMLPALVRKGLKAPVYCTEPTRELTIRYCRSWLKTVRSLGAEPPYSEADIEHLASLLKPVHYGEEIEPAPGIKVRFLPSGHLVGSSIVLVEAGGLRLAHFGDITFGDPVNPDPDLGFEADIAIVNGAYGDRLMPRGVLEERFIEVVKAHLARGGIVLIPTAAVGRGQAVCVTLWKHREKLGGARILVARSILDGLKLILQYSAYIREGFAELAQKVFESGFVEELGSSAEAAEEASRPGPKIIVAPNGMLLGGPAWAALPAVAAKPENAIVLVGYQAPGTPGRALEDREAPWYPRWPPGFTLKARVYRRELKAHVDAYDNLMICWRTCRKARLVLIHHGEEPKSSKLAARLAEDLGLRVLVPYIGSSIPVG